LIVVAYLHLFLLFMGAFALNLTTRHDVRSGANAAKNVGIRTFIGAICLCATGDTVTPLLADQTFPEGADAAIAKIAVLIGSALAAGLGAGNIAATPSERSPTTRTNARPHRTT